MRSFGWAVAAGFITLVTIWGVALVVVIATQAFGSDYQGTLAVLGLPLYTITSNPDGFEIASGAGLLVLPAITAVITFLLQLRVKPNKTVSS